VCTTKKKVQKSCQISKSFAVVRLLPEIDAIINAFEISKLVQKLMQKKERAIIQPNPRNHLRPPLTGNHVWHA